MLMLLGPLDPFKVMNVLVGTDELWFRWPPNPPKVVMRCVGSICLDLAGMEVHGFRAPLDK